MKFVINSDKSKLEKEIAAAQESLTTGIPVVGMVDEIIDANTIKINLLVPAFGQQPGTRVQVTQSLGSPKYRSLEQAIEGNKYASPLRKGEIVAFNQVYIENGVGKVGPVTARNSDMLRGDVQVLTAMAKLSRSSNSEGGATQMLTVVDAKAAMCVDSPASVERAWAIAKAMRSPGGTSGFVLRNASGLTGGEWFEDGKTGLKPMLEELERQDAFVGGALIELIPAWSIRVGRDQIGQDIDLRQQTSKPVMGHVSKLFSCVNRNEEKTGFLPCFIVIADEPEYSYKSPTGKTIRVAVAVQPCYRRDAVHFLKLSTPLRKSDATPNGISFLWSDEQVAAMKAERFARRGPDAEIVKKTSGKSSYSQNDDNDASDDHYHDEQDTQTIRKGNPIRVAMR